MRITTTLFALFAMVYCGFAQDANILELDPNQSMSITGKGPGQDATINPFIAENSIIVVTNIGKGVFTVRVQKEGIILQEVTVKPEQTRELLLSKGLEVYFDSEEEAKIAVSYKPNKKF